MLTTSSAPLVWIDCEMSGLARTDVLLQVACYVTDSSLTLLDSGGLNITLSVPDAILDGMDEWCTRTHAATGLTAAVRASTTTAAAAEWLVLEYVKRFVPERGVGLLAGNTVHADKVFLQREMPSVVDWLHYRILDVSAIKEAARRWCSDEVLQGVPEKKGLHEAGEDIRESIEEARYWRDVLFRPAGGMEKKGGT
ncbi:exonuclease family protein [Tricharina praecox]|uniref:exonuclease family protein n=1 Tax=Tricharina praecox TaxID=43433 RepID=UPI00221EE9C5|nr:exonuclease family protein [Tricharina praecox]KAI5842329.1 exonuclease family protein [Tricharina praecox]